MRVIIIIPGFPLNIEDIKGGVFSALSNLLNGFSNADIVIRVVSFNREIYQPLEKKYSHNIDIYYTPESKLPHVFNFIFNGSAVIKKHIKEFNPSVIHYAMSGYILFTKVFGLLNKVQMVTIHGIPFSEAKQKEKIREKLVWYSNGIAELLLCPKNIIHISNYSLALYRKKNKKIFTIIPNAVSPGYFELPLKDTTHNRLLYVGSIDANKNILFLLRVLKVMVEKHLSFSLSVLGDFTDQSYKEEVLSYIKENDLEEFVTFYGWVSQQKLQEVLAQSDILVVSSKQESLPMVIAEAMSGGKVVVSSSVGGIPEMITHGIDGFLFNVTDIESIVPILEQLHNNKPLVSQMQSQARQKATNTYHCDIVAQKTLTFYRQLLS